MKNKKSVLIILGMFFLILVVGGVTYAFYEYSRTGIINTIKVGRVSFVTRDTRTITLTNIQPVSREDIFTDTDNVGLFEIEIEGDTDYNQGIEYLVSSEDAHLTLNSGKKIPLGIDMEVSNLGIEDNNYFASRKNSNNSIYKKLVGNAITGNQELLVGWIAPNTETGVGEGINGKILIRAFIDEDKIAVSDTYDGKESSQNGTLVSWVNGRTVLTTEEWNSLENNSLSFKVKVEAFDGIWVENGIQGLDVSNLYVENNTKQFITRITNYSDSSQKGQSIPSENWELQVLNDDGSYTFSYLDSEGNNVSTESNSLDLTYAFTENKTISVTVKVHNSSEFNSANLKFRLLKNGTVVEEFTRTLTVGESNYCLDNGVNKLNDCLLVTQVGTNGATVNEAKTLIANKGSANVNNIATTNEGMYMAEDDYGNSYFYRGAVDNNNVYFGGYYWKIIRINGDGSIRMIYNGTVPNATGNQTQIGTSAFNTNYADPTYVGYMYGENELKEENISSEQTYINIDNTKTYYFGSGYTKNSTNHTFTLTNTIQSTWGNVENQVGTYKYTCLSETNGACKKILMITDYLSSTSAKVKHISFATESDLSQQNYSNITAATVYYFANDYEPLYDPSNSNSTMTFRLKGDIVSGTFESMQNDFASHPYTCKGTTDSATCQFVLRVENYVNTTNVKAKYITYKITSSQLDFRKDNKSSTIKTTVDNWYKNNFMNKVDDSGNTLLKEYVLDEGFCNDRSITNPTYNSGYLLTQHTFFAGKTRLYDNATKSATLKCPNSKDLFSVTKTKGNGKLTYPVGLITLDEVALAGGKVGTDNPNYYLVTNAYYWTFSPSYFRASNVIAYAFIVYPSGYVDYGSYVTGGYGVRPVINLRSDTLISGGRGTSDNPYTLSLS